MKGTMYYSIEFGKENEEFKLFGDKFMKNNANLYYLYESKKFSILSPLKKKEGINRNEEIKIKID